MKAVDVAELLISQCRNEGLTHYKLQKLLYYVQGFHLAINKEQLFEEQIIACSTGARVDEVHKIYSKFRIDDIPCYKVLDLDVNNKSHKIILDVCLIFKFCFASVMEELIMSEEPWIKAMGDRGVYSPGVPMDKTIMQEYFIKEYLNQ